MVFFDDIEGAVHLPYTTWYMAYSGLIVSIPSPSFLAY